MNLNALKSALYTALWTFVGSVAVLSIGWLQSVAKWASSSGHAPLPGLSTIGYAVIAAGISAAGGIVAFVVRFAQSKGWLPGKPPSFPTNAG